MEFTHDGGGLGKGGSVDLFVDGNKVGEGRVEGTVPMVFSADETTDVGTDGGTPVSDDHGPNETAFNGRISWVQIDVDDAAEDLDHLISADEQHRIAMARQLRDREGRQPEGVASSVPAARRERLRRRVKPFPQRRHLAASGER
jgi:hypothetical protein